jgi:hypothetical protein
VKRLIEEEQTPGSPEHLLALLVRATPRLQPGPLQKQRVLAAVTGGAKPNRGGRLAGVGAGAFVLAGAALAAAAVGHWGFGKPLREPIPTPMRAAPIAPLTAQSAPPPPPTDVGSVDNPAPPDLPTAAPLTGAPIERPSARIRTSTPLKDGEDPTPVLEAIRALRYNDDPVRAGVLLAQYLKAHPHSVLSEDASALSIEAAVARHDPRTAAALGRRYLAQFPSGRYRAFALKAMQPSAP